MILKNTTTGHHINVKDIQEAMHRCSVKVQNFPAHLCTLDGIPCEIETSVVDGIAVLTPDLKLSYIMPSRHHKNFINLLNGRTSTGHCLESGTAVFSFEIPDSEFVSLKYVGNIGLIKMSTTIDLTSIRLTKSELRSGTNSWHEYPSFTTDKKEQYKSIQIPYETIQVPCLPAKYRKTHKIVGISSVTEMTDLILDIIMDGITVDARWRHPHIQGLTGIVAKLKFNEIADIIQKNPILVQLPQVIKTKIVLIKTKNIDEWSLSETTTLLTIPATQRIPEGYTITCDPETKIWSEVKI